MTEMDSVEQRKAEAARGAGDNHGVGVNADEPSRADDAADEQAGAEPATEGSQDPATAAQEPPD